MKILMINSVCGVGSTGRICTDLANELNKQGHEVKIAYGRGNVCDEFKDYAVKIGSNFSVKLNGLKARIFDNEGFNAKRATKKFLKWAEEYNPEVLHLHNLHGYYLNVEMLFKWIKSRSNMKVLWTLHDCWAFTGHCSHFDYVNCNKWQTSCYNCEQKKEYPKSLLKDNCKSSYLRKKKAFTGVKNLQIITPSNWLKGVVEKSFLKKYEVNAIYNGIDTNIIKPTKSDFRKKYNLENKKIILGVASVWTKRKGFYDFIELSKIIDENTHIVMVGVNDKQLKFLPKNVLGLKKTFTLNELAEIYTASDVLFNSSVEESMGLTTIEALACGTPVIVYNKTAVPEVIDENCGIVLKENSPVAMLNAFKTINISKSCCIEKAKKFKKEDKYQEYISLYKN